jgi:preprotein translocase subunit YajC
MPTLFVSTVVPVLLMGGGSDATGGVIGFVLPLVLIFGVFYLFIYRPQQKREQEHQDMVDNLERGDQIVTIGGVHGKVVRIDEDSVLAQVDSSGTKLRFDKQAISSVNPNKDD